VRATHAAVRDAVREGTLASAHDVAEGGLAIALAECCLAGGLGASVALDAPDALQRLFGERPGSWFVVSAPREALDVLAARAPVQVIGAVGGDALRIAVGGETLELALDELRDAHGSLGRFFP
jgi:phosphoribosylformylglycinamidine synthase